MPKFIKRFANHGDGATALEYAIIAGLIALVIIAGVSLLGSHLSSIFSNAAAGIPAG